MTAFAALYRLGLDWTDVAQMKRDLLEGIARANADLLESFTKGA